MNAIRKKSRHTLFFLFQEEQNIEVIEEAPKIEVKDLTKVQQEMEEKNKRRRAALAQEVQTRQRKAQMESRMLKTIEDELLKLDMLLNADVSVIRDKIDLASVEFADASRRFDRAETEYVEAKFDLQRKTEAKVNFLLSRNISGTLTTFKTRSDILKNSLIRPLTLNWFGRAKV